MRIILISALIILIRLPYAHIKGQNCDLINVNNNLFQINPSFIGDDQNLWNINNTLTTLNTGLKTNLNTFVIAGDYQINLNKGNMNAGLYLLQRSIINAPLNEKTAFFSFAYHLLRNQHSFNIGIQTGLVAKSILIDQLTFPDQYDRETGNYNPNNGTNENLPNSKLNAYNLNLGFSYSNLRDQLKIGISLFNLTRPNLSFNEITNKAPIRVSTVARINIPLDKNNQLQPFTMLMFDIEYIEWLIGSNYILNTFNDQTIFSLGAFLKLRNQNEPTDLICQLGYRIKQLNIFLGYAKPISGKNNIPRNWQKFEIAIIINGLKPNPENLKLPCNFF